MKRLLSLASLQRELPKEIAQTPSRAQLLEADRPQIHTLRFAADVYFRFCHNQPYSLFHEATFRQGLADDSFPPYLIWAFLSAARRYSSLSVTPLDSADDASTYAAKAWECINLPWTGSAAPHEVLSVIQAIVLIVSTENPAGLCGPAYMKLGFAIRLALHSKLHLEPPASMPFVEREERKRAFWSLYLQDKLISLSRGRYCIIRDEECMVSLPCSEAAFREQRVEQTYSLQDLTGDCINQEAVDNCSPLGLIMAMASTLGKVSHYVLQENRDPYIGLPWFATSPYSTLSSALLQAEHYFGINDAPSEGLRQRCIVDGIVDQHLAGSFIFAKAIFHLSHSLLHHPFLIQQRLQSIQQKAPPMFMRTAWEKCKAHAKSITDLRQMKDHNVLILSSLYGYCTMVAGTIHALSMNDEREDVRQENERHYRAALDSLHDLSCYWGHAALMAKRLKSFHSYCQSRGQGLRPCTVGQDRAAGDMRVFWQSVDYTSLSTPTRPGSPTMSSDTTDEAGWPLLADLFDFSGFGGFAEGVDVFSMPYVN
ncbi:unnamed protein product, partial [Clonostachys rosea]